MPKIDVFSAWLFVVIKNSLGSEGLRIYFESVEDGPEMEVPYECQTATMHEDHVNFFCDSCREMCREDPWLNSQPLLVGRGRIFESWNYFISRKSDCNSDGDPLQQCEPCK